MMRMIVIWWGWWWCQCTDTGASLTPPQLPCLSFLLLVRSYSISSSREGNIHLKSVEYVEAEEGDERSTFALRMVDKSSVSFIATSSRPEVQTNTSFIKVNLHDGNFYHYSLYSLLQISDAQYRASWVIALRKAQGMVKGSFGSAANTGMMF